MCGVGCLWDMASALGRPELEKACCYKPDKRPHLRPQPQTLKLNMGDSVGNRGLRRGTLLRLSGVAEAFQQTLFCEWHTFLQDNMEAEKGPLADYYSLY